MQTKNIKISDFTTDIIFIILLSVVFFFFNYNQIILKAPQSTHMWRQADCLSFTENLAQGDCDFFHMQTHNLNADNFTTGAGVSEAPILYWTISRLYKIFGNDYRIYRIVNTLLFFIGVFYLFKTLKLLFEKDFIIFLLPFFIFASPVIAYYAANFLTDTSAFALMLIAWYYFFKFKKTTKKKFFYFFLLFLTLSGLLKILSLTSFIAVGIIYLIELFTSVKFNDNKKIFSEHVKYLIPFLLPLIIIAAWYLYAIYYNNIHNTDYFANRTLPLWELSSDKINSILLKIKTLHFKEYYNPSYFAVTLFLFVFNLIFIKKSDLFLAFINILLFFSNIAIFVIWFGAFKDHDYYFINLIIFYVFNLITFFDILKKSAIKKYIKTAIKISFFLFLLFLLSDAQKKLNIRYNGWRNNDIKTYKTYYEIRPYLKSIGITKKDTIISIGDITNSYSLQALNLKGWTQTGGRNKNTEDIMKCIKNGAVFLFVKDSILLKENYLSPFTKHKIGNYKNIFIFDLRNE